MKSFKIFYMVVLMLAVMASGAFAIPALQIYIEGSTYDIPSETWVTDDSSFKLWVLGDVGAYGNISGVSLVTAFLAGETGTITITPSTATEVTDPSTPSAPVYAASGFGTAPTLSDGSALPSHDIYGSGTNWISYSIGNFTLTDSPIGDYITNIPTSWPNMGQINAYDVDVTGYSMVHFDAYDHYVLNQKNKVKYVFAPFSHDGEGYNVPEPGTLVLLGMGLFGLGLFGRRK